MEEVNGSCTRLSVKWDNNRRINTRWTLSACISQWLMCVCHFIRLSIATIRFSLVVSICVCMIFARARTWEHTFRTMILLKYLSTPAAHKRLCHGFFVCSPWMFVAIFFLLYVACKWITFTVPAESLCVPFSFFLLFDTFQSDNHRVLLCLEYKWWKEETMRNKNHSYYEK